MSESTIESQPTSPADRIKMLLEQKRLREERAKFEEEELKRLQETEGSKEQENKISEKLSEREHALANIKAKEAELNPIRERINILEKEVADFEALLPTLKELGIVDPDFNEKSAEEQRELAEMRQAYLDGLAQVEKLKNDQDLSAQLKTEQTDLNNTIDNISKNPEILSKLEEEAYNMAESEGVSINRENTADIQTGVENTTSESESKSAVSMVDSAEHIEAISEDKFRDLIRSVESRLFEERKNIAERTISLKDGQETLKIDDLTLPENAPKLAELKNADFVTNRQNRKNLSLLLEKGLITVADISQQINSVDNLKRVIQVLPLEQRISFMQDEKLKNVVSTWAENTKNSFEKSSSNPLIKIHSVIDYFRIPLNPRDRGRSSISMQELQDVKVAFISTLEKGSDKPYPGELLTFLGDSIDDVAEAIRRKIAPKEKMLELIRKGMNALKISNRVDGQDRMIESILRLQDLGVFSTEETADLLKY